MWPRRPTRLCGLAIWYWDCGKYPRISRRDTMSARMRAARPCSIGSTPGGAKHAGSDAATPPLPRKRRREGEWAIKRDLCLVGYAGLASGRAEDLRMTALALS